jgi:hypothetical protein
VPFAGRSGANLFLAPVTATTVFLRLEYSPTQPGGAALRLGFRADATSVWSYLPFLPVAGTAFGGSLPLGAAALRVGFMVQNTYTAEIRAYAEVSYLRFAALDATAVIRCALQ